MKLLYSILLCFTGLSLSAQLIDSFDDQSFPSSPTWVGDVDDFIVNESGELQLNEEASGESSIFSSFSLPSDTAEIAMKFRLEFPPSASNKLRVYLMVDNTDISIASGYFFEFGESGSTDALKLVRLDSGAETELAVGSLGAVADDPEVNFRLDVFPSGLLSFNVDYTGGSFLEEDILVMDPTYGIETMGFFGFTCGYTATRADLFYFDDVRVGLFEKDETGPTALSANLVSPTTVVITFDEPLDETSAEIAANYNVDGLNAAAAILLNNPTEVRVTFDSEFPSDDTFTLTIENVEDENGNPMGGAASFEILYARSPLAGDIFINEIMFAANVDNEDYVELINATDEYLNLTGYALGNATKTDNQLRYFPERTVIEPKAYLAITENKELVVTVYDPIAENQILQLDIPDYNNDSGNVLLANPSGAVLDSYDYDEDAHNSLLSAVKGVSLERKSLQLDTNDPEAWTSAAGSSNFGTPGYANSNSLPEVTIEENFQFIEKVFSPNSDGDKDVMVLGYELDKSGYVANIEVRDVGGFLIKTLKANETLSNSGLITWDGLDMDGKLANIGMYILVGEIFHLDGEVIPLKKVCVLAGQFE